MLGLGTLLAAGNRKVLSALRRCASDPRWRIREAVAMALKRWGETDTGELINAMEEWSESTLLEQRAAIAALCEPKLLVEETDVLRVLEVLDRVTDLLQQVQDRKGEDYRVLKKGLGYCWSVAVAALPETGKNRMEKWFASTDKDVLWVMKENLRKKRLVRMDEEWVLTSRNRLGMT